MSIIVQNLTKSFFSGHAHKSVLNAVSLEVKPGEIFALMGPNGAGKTTLLKILSTLILPDSGTASIAGNDLLARPADVRASVGLVFDAERSFYQMLTVEDNLSFFSRMHAVPRGLFRERLGRLSRAYGLDAWLTTVMNSCPSGVRQRAALVRALLTDPQVLLIDEPTRSLDPDSRKEILASLWSAVHDGKKACIMVTHEAREAETMARTIGYLKDGHLSLRQVAV